MAVKKLEVKNLQISFRTQEGILKAVRDISFDLHKGETLAIVGESGSGKSVTSKAIIGILAGNSIVEGGEILYDGQDLLKISEEDFHKIRGEKISMIFQDPLSSLNPIMKIGKQLTEAMVLNGKARQKSSQTNFNSKLALLKKNINEVYSDSVSENEYLCKTFDEFSIQATKLESSYNFANEEAVSLKVNIHQALFLLSKNQKVDTRKLAYTIVRQFPNTLHKFVVSNDKEYQTALLEINKIYKEKEKPTYEKLLPVCEKIINILDKGINKEKPNFFRLGYYMLKNPGFDETSLPVNELDAITLAYLDDNFMKNFIEIGASAMEHSHIQSLAAKKEILPKLKEYREFIANSAGVIDKKEAYKRLKETSVSVKAAIDTLTVVKNSVEYSYGVSLKHELDWYYQGIKNNPKAQSKYEKKQAKWDKLVKQGKQPTWKVIPPHIIDLDLSRGNMLKILDNLIKHYEDEFNNEDIYTPKVEMVALIEYMKQEASNFTYKVTQGIAKARALELMKEVGIPEPEIRFNQYPFEVAGGMRQRIVIAIALSANPDILICDEPTTALDVTIQSQILELINRIKVERQLSVIFITHDLGVVANMADRIAVMYAGKIVEVGTNEDIFYDPKHPYTWALLSSTPDLETKDKLDAIPGTPPNMIYPPKGDAFADRNKYALEIDFEEQPPLFEVSETHFAATWLLHPNAPKVELPKTIKERIERMTKEAKEL